ncbi:helix-turn-helix domain-containing protein [Anoxybacillus ayderensis]|uniref:helix-turn-helix domain-containing protein n=1 Tax=Anoxybacillus ayderensis TaxID=265546 RepID=UPI00038634F3|nr:helix-turn-helix transcriptional regulator [Anoxybacillus ayderensis]EPZ37779.1 helix-turn-helix domain-containing protein [Anoxybacillus ayderensis]
MIKIKQIRQMKGLSQAELSAIAKVSQSLISDIENGRVSPTLRVLQKLADALDTKLNELLKEDDDASHAS